MVSGSSGLNNKSEHLLVLETPDGLSWLRGGEIILTAGYAFINNESIKGEIIKKAYEKNVAAICIKVLRYFGDIPASLIQDSEKYGIPLFLIPRDINYTDILSKYYRALYDKETSNILKMNLSYQKLLELRTKNSSIDLIVEETSKITNLDIQFKNFLEVDNNLDNNNLIRINNKEFGSYLEVKGYPQITDFQKNCINYLLYLIEDILELQQNILLSQSVNNRMITEIIMENQNVDDAFIISVMKYLDWESVSFRGIYFKWQTPASRNNSMIRILIEQCIVEKFLFVTDNEGMIVFLPDNDNTLNNTIKKIFGNKNSYRDSFKIGISSQYDELRQLNPIYHEAKQTVELSNDFLLCIDDLRVGKELISMLANKNTSARMLNLLTPIMSYDKENGAVLLNTLDHYFKHNFNNKKSSESLHIHVETLRYRLNKIEELSGLSVHNSKDLLLLMLALTVYKFEVKE